MKTSLVAVGMSLWKSEDGAIISAELVLVMTIAVLAMIVGLHKVSLAVNAELNDVAEAFGAISQTFCFEGVSVCNACVSGSSFNDHPDFCDCARLEQVGHIHAPEKCE